MIKFLRVRNLATIEDLEVHLDEGFSILTGETGAGKSIIIDAIRLILGDKGSPDLVRTGRKEAFIEAVFDVSRQPIDLAVPAGRVVRVEEGAGAVRRFAVAYDRPEAPATWSALARHLDVALP